MRFTKKAVDIINKELGRYHTLTPEEIEAGEVEITIKRFGSTTIKKISRGRYGTLYVSCHFEGDSYRFQDGAYEKPDAAFAKAVRY